MISIDLLLLRHFSGTATAEDEAQIARWTASDPRHLEHFEELRRFWNSAADLEPDPTADPEPDPDPDGPLAFVDRDYIPLHRATPAGYVVVPEPMGPPPQEIPTPETRSWHSSRPARAAAVVAVLIGSGVVLSTPQGRWVAPPIQSHATAAGERSTLRLPDGSVVTLAPESELRYPSRFTGDAREVTLRGAGYFEVAADADRPFSVEAGNTVTRVLGTRFVVRAYSGDPAVEVGVAEGHVAVRSNAGIANDPVEVTPGHLAQVDPQGIARVVQQVNLDPILGWLSGRLVFRERPLREIARELERWYDIEIRIEDPALAARQLSLSIQDAALDEVLEVIAASLDAHFAIDGRSVALRPGGAAT